MTLCTNEGHLLLSFSLTVLLMHRSKPTQVSTTVKTTYLMDVTVWQPKEVDLIYED